MKLQHFKYGWHCYLDTLFILLLRGHGVKKKTLQVITEERESCQKLCLSTWKKTIIINESKRAPFHLFLFTFLIEFSLAKYSCSIQFNGNYFSLNIKKHRNKPDKMIHVTLKITNEKFMQSKIDITNATRTLNF